MNERPRVAVIGLGAQGLVTVKNLLEQDLDVTGFDKNDYVGGIWHYTAEHRVSALPTTVVNVSKEKASFTDFAFPEEVGSYPTSADVDRYLNAYCDHFKLRSHLRLGITINSIVRDDIKDKWILNIQNKDSARSETIEFEKLVMAVGPHNKPIYPKIQDQDKFEGEFTHAIRFKDPLDFQHKRVMVIGVSNSAADTSTSLVDVASKVYLSHSRGAIVLPRILKKGASLDHQLTYRMGMLKDTMEDILPTFSRKVYDGAIAKTMQAEFGSFDPQWNLHPPPSIVHHVPCVTDALIPALQAGTIESTAAPARVVGAHDIELTDGTILHDIDSIICCTGYDPDFSILGPYDPTLLPDGTRTTYTPRLYQNIFSLQHPASLAFIGLAILLQPAFLTADLASMALAQLWSPATSPSLPPQSEMEAWYATHTAWVSSIRSLHPNPHTRGGFVKFSVKNGPWFAWAESVAGTHVDEHLSYFSVRAWRYWVGDRRFANLLVDGIWSPFHYRLFASERRRTWDGAREAIETINEGVRRREAERRKMTSG